MPSKREQFYDDQFSKGKSRFEAVAKDVLRIYSSNQKTRYVFDNEKGLGCGLNKGMMYRLICFREQSNYDSKSAEMFQYGDINQHVSNHVENVILLTKVNSEKQLKQQDGYMIECIDF